MDENLLVIPPNS